MSVNTVGQRRRTTSAEVARFLLAKGLLVNALHAQMARQHPLGGIVDRDLYDAGVNLPLHDFLDGNCTREQLEAAMEYLRWRWALRMAAWRSAMLHRGWPPARLR